MVIMELTQTQSDRTIRYQRILEGLGGQQEFRLDAAKSKCAFEKPIFVSRVVSELVQDGWLVRDPIEETYYWNKGKGEFQGNKWVQDKVVGVQITATPKSERPREKLLENGVETLTDAELIAILVRSGRPGESAVMAGQKVAREFSDRLDQLPLANAGELKEISKAVSASAYCQIMAGIELGRRIAAVAGPQSKPKSLSSSDAAIEFCKNHFARLIQDGRQEEFHVITLDTKNHPIATHCVTVGTLDASLVHPREVFRVAIKDAASSVILVHNHPSGDPTPSREDRQVTDRLTESGKLLGIDVLDHIVLGSSGCVSIRAEA